MRARIAIAALACAGAIAVAVILLIPGHQSAITFKEMTVRGVQLPVPGGWAVDLSRPAPTALFAHPRAGIGEESLRVENLPGKPQQVANAYAAVARIGAPTAAIKESPVSRIQGAQDCWLVTAVYQRLRTPPSIRLESRDLFCARGQDFLAHLDLVVPASAGGASLTRQFESAVAF